MKKNKSKFVTIIVLFIISFSIISYSKTLDVEFQWHIKPQFDSANKFSEGLAAVKKGDKWGFIDRGGTFIIEPQFDDAKYFAENLAAVKKDDKWGFIDRGGVLIIEPQFDDAEYFSGNLAEVVINQEHAYIDKSGHLIFKLPIGYTKMGNSKCEFIDGLIIIGKDNKWGFIDKTGAFVVEPQFDDVRDFSEGLAAVKKDWQWGFIDKSGKVVIKIRYNKVHNFSEGLAAVVEDDNCGFIDKSGKYKINHLFYCGDGQDSSYYFSGGLASVCNKYKWGAIDKSGRFVIKPQFDGLKSFYGGLALAGYGEPMECGDAFLSKEIGFINKSGKFVFGPNMELNNADPYEEGFWIDSNFSKFIGYKGNSLIEINIPYYNVQFSEGLGAVEEDGKWGFVVHPLLLQKE